MTDDQYRVLVNYIRDIADVIGLKDWQFVLERKPAEDFNIASTEIWGDSVTASVFIGPLFWKYGPRMQREVLVHELIHWHTDKLYKAAREPLRISLGHQAYDVALASLKQNHELAVDAIAAAWARFLPLINWTSTEPIYGGYEPQPGVDDPPMAKD